ncbi:MAG TPA: ArsC/Spx/MgsR family protein [Saprospiraceae bacterium]|nr:ArsC/Spx/MgsR family protein [Saprospiraceae bacterium]HMP14012.1 ArsC/Spx/MgsR family protein [Saprospiraceae bacterium]
MKKIYHLSSCKTCQKIIAELHNGAGFELQDIKQQTISETELDWLRERTGSYESLFSRKAMKFRSMGLHERSLSEADYRQLILSEYTFLKRPVIVIGDTVFAGNAKTTIQAAKAML